MDGGVVCELLDGNKNDKAAYCCCSPKEKIISLLFASEFSIHTDDDTQHMDFAGQSQNSHFSFFVYG
jgi:hypothetical protein